MCTYGCVCVHMVVHTSDCTFVYTTVHTHKNKNTTYLIRHQNDLLIIFVMHREPTGMHSNHWFGGDTALEYHGARKLRPTTIPRVQLFPCCSCDDNVLYVFHSTAVYFSGCVCVGGGRAHNVGVVNGARPWCTGGYGYAVFLLPVFYVATTVIPIATVCFPCIKPPVEVMLVVASSAPRLLDLLSRRCSNTCAKVQQQQQ